MSRQLNSLEALAVLSDGKEIQYLSTQGTYEDMDTVNFNPIRRPGLTWRVKPEEWEDAYHEWVNANDVLDTTETEEAFKAGWEEARKRHG